MKKQVNQSGEWSKVINELESEVAKLQAYDRTILEHIGNIEGKSVLDYGAGPAVMASFLRDLGGEIKVYDISPEMRELASEKIGRAAVYDSNEAIPNRAFDIILCNLVLCIVDEPDVPEILKVVYRKLKNSGVVYIGFCNPKIYTVKESNLDYRFPTGNTYEEIHEYKKVKKEGNYEIIEKHRPITWYGETIKEAGFEISEEIFTPEYTLKGSKIRDFIIFKLTK